MAAALWLDDGVFDGLDVLALQRFFGVIHIGPELCRRMGSHNPPSYGFTLLEDLAKKRPPNARTAATANAP